jgi:hypothetical protein
MKRAGQKNSVRMAMREDLSNVEIRTLLQDYFRSLIGEGSLENLQKTLLFSLINGFARSSKENPKQNDVTLLDLAPIGNLSGVSATRDRVEQDGLAWLPASGIESESF